MKDEMTSPPARRPVSRAVALALLACVAPLGAHAQDGGKEPGKEAGASLKAVVFDVEPVGLPGTAAMRDKLAAATALLRKLVADKGYAVVDTAPQAKEITANLPLSQCNGCDQRIAKALGADIEVSTALQAVSAATYSLSGSVKDVRTDRLLRQGVVDLRGEDGDVWAHGVKFLMRERLFEPPLPADAAGLSAAVTAAEKGADK